VKIDGQGLPPAEIAAQSLRGVDTVARVDITAITADDLAQMLKEMAPRLRSLSEKLENLGVHLQSGAQKEALEIIRETSLVVGDFCSISRFVDLFPERFTEVRSFFPELAPLLSNFCEAMETNDIVLTGDLAEYEIKPRILAIAQTLEGW
jgi:hypothetical protein